MNSWLADVYGTGSQGEDLEKIAQDMLLVKLAEAEGVDISGLSPDQLSALAAEVLEENQGGEPGAGGGEAAPTTPIAPVSAPAQAPVTTEIQDPAGLSKEAAAKFEEADFLGRVMAHSFTQELDKIKTANDMAAGGSGQPPAHMLGGHPPGAAPASGGLPPGGAAPPVEVNVEEEEPAGGPVVLHKHEHVHHDAGKGSKEKQEKVASAIEKMARIKAAEILTANGINPATGLPLNTPATTGAGAPPAQAPAQAQVASAVDTRAAELLKEAGYTLED